VGGLIGVTNLAYHDEIFFGFFSFIQNTNQGNELDYFIIMSTPYAEGFYQKMGAIKVGSYPSKVRPAVSLPLLKISL
jgi:hypothetical protein